MKLKKIRADFRAATLKLADYGIPVPMFRDPFTKRSSLPFTMAIIAIILVVIGIVGKLSIIVGGIDMPNAMQFLSTSAALYFGHSWVHKETTDAEGRTQTLDIKTEKPAKDE